MGKIKEGDCGNKTKEVKVLLEQYKVGVELYRHEDVLNWTKINHLFYINGGLWAVIGLSSSTGSAGTPMFEFSRLIMVIVAAAGIIVCLALGTALWIGTKYMKDRKAKVVNIEKALKSYGGETLVDNKLTEITMCILKLVPFIFVTVWLIILVNI
ncbi:MAG: RipA family octameric membrane protein [Planctomycetota bacterium]|jgi:hypothetical protein